MKRALFIGAVALGACGGLSSEVMEPQPRAKPSLVEEVKSPDALRRLMVLPVTLGNLLFADAACEAAFPAGEVAKDRFDELARCLAGLGLRPSVREDRLGDVVMMSYGPGFEVEARVLQQGERSVLVWIGFASQFQGSQNVPTLDVATFESLRTGGERAPTFDAVTADAIEKETSKDDGVATAWLKVCLDEKGAISGLESYEPSSYVAMDAFQSAAITWTFKPFVFQGTPMAVCSLVFMAHPQSKAPTVETLPLPPPPTQMERPTLTLSQRAFATLVEGRRISGEKMIVPDDRTKIQIQEFVGSKVITIQATFRTCIGVTGEVESVLPLLTTGFATYDSKLLAGIKKWRYAPYMINGKAVPVCTAVRFIYQQR